MTPDQLERFREYIKRLTDESLNEARLAVMFEMTVRGRLMKLNPESPREGELKDCGPNREP